MGMKLLDNKAYRKMYEKMKQIYVFEFCPIDDINTIVDFIDKHWKRNHALCLSRELMDWQFRDEKRGVYNILTAKSKENGEIHAILGVIPANGGFEEEKPVHYYLSIAKTLQDKSPALTVFLCCYMEEVFNVSSSSSNSFGPLGEQIFRKIGYAGGKMNHFYIANKKMNRFKIIGNFDGRYMEEGTTDPDKDLKNISGEQFLNFLDTIRLDKYAIAKTKFFYRHRYLEHPIYKYNYLAVMEGENLTGVFVYRLIKQNGFCIKLIDFAGESEKLCGLSNKWQEILVQNEAEFIDMYNVGFSERTMRSSGFLKRCENDKIIIPHYFEPFVLKNIELVYGINTESEKELIMFRGDGDQDRPQII